MLQNVVMIYVGLILSMGSTSWAQPQRELTKTSLVVEDNPKEDSSKERPSKEDSSKERPSKEDSSKENTSKKETSFQHGWSLTPSLGVATCIPTSLVQCTQSYPGVTWMLAIEHRWMYFGLGIDWDQSHLIITGQGSETVSHSTSHLGIMFRGYIPIHSSVDLNFGVGLGYGDLIVKDTQNESSVEWSSLWRDIKLSLGAQIELSQSWSIESQLMFKVHNGGQRCVLYQKAGPCVNLSDLPESERGVASHLHLMTGARYTF